MPQKVGIRIPQHCSNYILANTNNATVARSKFTLRNSNILTRDSKRSRLHSTVDIYIIKTILSNNFSYDTTLKSYTAHEIESF